MGSGPHLSPRASRADALRRPLSSPKFGRGEGERGHGEGEDHSLSFLPVRCKKTLSRFGSKISSDVSGMFLALRKPMTLTTACWPCSATILMMGVTVVSWLPAVSTEAVWVGSSAADGNKSVA